jgi:hypothetical protein
MLIYNVKIQVSNAQALYILLEKRNLRSVELVSWVFNLHKNFVSQDFVLYYIFYFR